MDFLWISEHWLSHQAREEVDRMPPLALLGKLTDLSLLFHSFTEHMLPWQALFHMQ